MSGHNAASEAALSLEIAKLLTLCTDLKADVATLKSEHQKLRADFIGHDHGAGNTYSTGSPRFAQTPTWTTSPTAIQTVTLVSPADPVPGFITQQF